MKFIRVACILDEFSYECFRYECSLLPLSKRNWRGELLSNLPDILFVESAWRGHLGSWRGKISRKMVASRELTALVMWCKENGIPTVFWNKEDPVHFDTFIHSAKLFDYIFTTDVNSIDKYKQETGSKNIFVLPFAAQPVIHNPINNCERKDALCFAGTYHRNKYIQRQLDMNILFDTVLANQYELSIYDRNYESGKENYIFPYKYLPYIKGNIQYSKMNNVYKEYKILLNVNSVLDSPTMFSRRVFESLACNTPVVSTYALGIENMLKRDYIKISKDKDMTANYLKLLMEDRNFYEATALKGLRDILSRHTYEIRFAYIIEKLDIKYIRTLLNVSVFSFVKSQKEFDNILSLFNQQTYKHKKLHVILDKFFGHKNIINKSYGSFVKLYTSESISIFDKLSNFSCDEYICYFDTNHYFGENYLIDLVNAVKYSRADIIGKKAYFTFKNKEIHKRSSLVVINQTSQYKYVSEINIDRCILAKDIFKDIAFSKLLDSFIKNESLDKYIHSGYLIFSNDKYNFIENIINAPGSIEKTDAIKNVCI